MCGIAGVSALNDNTRRILPFLAYEMEERGDDSWGIATPNYIHKELGPITCGWQEGDQSVLDLLEEDKPVSIHTRAGSVGSIKEENSHPFVVVGSKCTVVGMHNGCVANWKELEVKYNVKYEVDSQFICHFIANGMDTKEIRGWGAFVWLQWENDEKGDPTGEPTLNFVRFNMQDFQIAKLIDDDKTTTLVWCSTKNALIKACNMADVRISFFYTMEPETHYRYLKEREAEAVIDKGYPLAVMGKMVFGNRTTYSQHNPPQACSTNSTYKGAKPSTNDYEPGTNNVGKQNPTQTTATASNDTTPSFSVGEIGKKLRENNRCMLCKTVYVDRTKKAICNPCEADINKIVEGLHKPTTPDTRKYLFIGLDWDYNKEGELVFIDRKIEEDDFLTHGC